MYEFGCLIALFILACDTSMLVLNAMSIFGHNMRKSGRQLRWTTGVYEKNKLSVLRQLIVFFFRAALFISLSWYSVVSNLYMKIYALLLKAEMPDFVRLVRWRLHNDILSAAEVDSMLSSIESDKSAIDRSA